VDPKGGRWPVSSTRTGKAAAPGADGRGRISATVPRGGSGLTRHAAGPTDRPAIASALARSFLGRLGAAARDRLLDQAGIVGAVPGAIVYSRAERPQHVGIVVDGLTRAYATSTDARQLTVVYGRTGSPATVSALAQDRETPVWIQALVPSTIAEFPAGLVREMAATDPSIGLELAAELQALMMDAMAALGASVFGSLRGLLAWHLLQLAEPVGPDGRMLVPIAQPDLALIVGTAREVVARALRTFREEGLVETAPSSILIVSPGGIAAIAGGHGRSAGASR
jgi:CRP/FNR family transcriptional regulator, cyclic AMP receptor protein